MRFKSVVIVLIALFSANMGIGQNTLNNIGLTSSTPASVAFSLRQLSTTYTEPLVRISVNSSFYDVYPDATTKNFSLSSKISAAIGTYNAAVSAPTANALSSIVTSGSTNATIAIWYDQSGNGVHVSSNTSTARIITAGSINTIFGQPTIYFSGTNGQSLLTSSNTVDYTALSGATVNAVAQNVATTSSFAGIIGAAYALGNPGYNITYDATIGKGYASDGAGCTYGGISSSTTPQIITNIFTNTTTNLSNTYINGVLKTPSSTSPCTLTHTSGSRIYIGSARGYGPASFIGNISEAIIFPKQLVDAERNPLETNQSATYFSPGVSITSSATNNTSCSGVSVTFTANIFNFTSTPTYQWYKNGTAISGATSSTYTTSSLSNNDQIKVICNNPPSIVNDNSLQLWLDVGNSASYSSGTTWSDLSGNGRNATLNNGASFDATSKSIVTNGVDQYVSVPLFNSSITNITMQTWVYINANSKGAFISNGTSSYSIGIGSSISGEMSNNGNRAWMLFSSVRYIDTNTDFPSGWHLVTMTMDANAKPSYYLDGSFVYTSPSGSNPRTVSNSFNLGAVPGDGGKYYNGKFAAAYFYNRVLTASEISQNYSATVGSIGGGSGGGVTSNTITVSVSPGPTSTITVSGDACINKTTLSTTSGVYTYIWTKDNVIISGATTNTYMPPTAGDYKVSVSNGTCSSTSSATTIYTCGVTADGKMSQLLTSTTLISKEGAINNGNGIDERGLILKKPWIYGTVTTRTGRIWIDRNLGATRVAQSSTDVQAYGDYFEWGRPADGHEKQIVSGTTSDYTTVRSSTSVPGNSKYIFPSDGSKDWLITPDNTLWTGVNAPNNPCPAGFRIPTEAEWAAEAAVFTSQNVSGSFEAGFGLKLPLPGMAGSANNITAIDTYGQYLTQTAYNDGKVKYFGVHPSVIWFDTNYHKITGQSCRCIKD